MFQHAQRRFALAGIAAGLAFAADSVKIDSMNVVVEGGTASFIANTNMPAISVKGKSAALQARVNLHRTAGGIELDRIHAAIPVKSLATGMGLRDEHMRKYIFTTADGNTPDIVFEAENTACPTAREGACQVAGTLSIRGVARPFTVPLKIREDGAAFKATGDGVVKLSDYAIEQPSQFGVKCTNEVLLHFDFSAKQASADMAALGGAR